MREEWQIGSMLEKRDQHIEQEPRRDARGSSDTKGPSEVGPPPGVCSVDVGFILEALRAYRLSR